MNVDAVKDIMRMLDRAGKLGGNQRDLIENAIYCLENGQSYRAEQSLKTMARNYGNEGDSDAEREVEQNIAMGSFIPLKKWKILYANGSVGYQLYSKDLAIEVAERKKVEYGGSYTIEEVTEGEEQ